MSVTQRSIILIDIFNTPVRSGEELLFCCPKCDHPKKKFSCNVNKNCFKCWVCGFSGRDITRLVKRYGTYRQQQEWNRYNDKIDLSSSFLSDILFGEQETDRQTVSLPEEFNTLTCNSNLTSIFPRQFLRDRGISQQDILKWKIGYCAIGEYAERIIIPSFNNEGRVDYFIARTYKNDWIKYKNPPAQRNNIIFNELYVDWSADLVLTEGVFDAIVAGNAIPLLGSALSERSRLFQEVIKHDTAIYIALDYDAEKKAKHLIIDMIKYDIEIYKIDTKGFQDVGSMTKEEFKMRKNAAIQITSSNLFEYQLRGIM